MGEINKKTKHRAETQQLRPRRRVTWRRQRPIATKTRSTSMTLPPSAPRRHLTSRAATHFVVRRSKRFRKPSTLLVLRQLQVQVTSTCQHSFRFVRSVAPPLLSSGATQTTLRSNGLQPSSLSVHAPVAAACCQSSPPQREPTHSEKLKR